MRSQTLTVFLFATSLVLAGCHYADQDTPEMPPPHSMDVAMKDQAKNGVMSLKQGMTQDQVFAILGQPTVFVGPGVYRYGSIDKDYLDLAFDGNRLVSLTGQYNDTSAFMDKTDPAPLTAKRGHDPKGHW